MQLSKQTIEIFKNFSTINSNILVEPGNVVKTISPQKNILARAVVEETFPVSFGIWDLNRFLAAVGLFTNPDFDFFDNYVLISGAGGSVKYYYSEPKLLTVPTQEITMPESAVRFSVTQDDLQEVMKAAAVLQLPSLVIEGSGNDIDIVARDKTNPTSNSFSRQLILLEKNIPEESYSYTFRTENLKIIRGDYIVNITEKIVSEFVNQDLDLTYWIALEPN